MKVQPPGDIAAGAYKVEAHVSADGATAAPNAPQVSNADQGIAQLLKAIFHVEVVPSAETRDLVIRRASAATLPETTIPVTPNRRRCDRAIWIGLGRTPDPDQDVPAIVVSQVISQPRLQQAVRRGKQRCPVQRTWLERPLIQLRAAGIASQKHLKGNTIDGRPTEARD